MFYFIIGVIVGAAFSPFWLNLYKKAKGYLKKIDAKLDKTDNGV